MTGAKRKRAGLKTRRYQTRLAGSHWKHKAYASSPMPLQQTLYRQATPVLVPWAPVKALIVDDEVFIRRGVRVLLAAHQSGMEILEADDGREAVSFAAEFRPDIVVMDISMPHVNGLEAAIQIRRILPRCSIVLLSQYDVPGMEQEAKLLCSAGFVSKSSIWTQLIPALKELDSVPVGGSKAGIAPGEICSGGPSDA